MVPGLVLQRIGDDPLVRAARLAVTLGHPIRDCIHLALADQLGCALTTCDVGFRDRVGDPECVRVLAELV
jgi:predicted nucleic acid-binding protein